MRTDIETGIRELIGRVSRQDVSLLGRDDDLVERLGVDSLQGLQILAGVEKEFDVRLPDEELIRMRTIGRIVEVVQRVGPVTDVGAGWSPPDKPLYSKFEV